MRRYGQQRECTRQQRQTAYKRGTLHLYCTDSRALCEPELAGSFYSNPVYARGKDRLQIRSRPRHVPRPGGGPSATAPGKALTRSATPSPPSARGGRSWRGQRLGRNGRHSGGRRSLSFFRCASNVSRGPRICDNSCSWAASGLNWSQGRGPSVD